jgi:hypothetical protein
VTDGSEYISGPGEAMMKRILMMLISVMFFLLFLPAVQYASEWWLLGTVKGDGIRHKPIPVLLVKIDDAGGTVVAKTRTNARGQYAFSDPGEGLPPKAYKVVLNVRPDLSIDISLADVTPRGWMPAIIPPVTVYW